MAWINGRWVETRDLGTNDIYGSYNNGNETVALNKAEYDAINTMGEGGAGKLVTGTEGLAARGGMFDTVKGWFTPGEGQKTSVGNNMMDALGTGIQAGTGLAGLHLTNKTNKANQALTERKLANEEKQAKYLKSIDAGNAANKQAFARNLGGGASYVGLA